MTESTVGLFAAKTHFSKLLERVSQGARITITRHGKPVAMLVPPATETSQDVSDTIERMLEFRRNSGPLLGRGLSLETLRDEGRGS